MNTFYIYRHLRNDKNTPFYVGKGSGHRAFDTWDRNYYWKNIVNKHGYTVEILYEDLTEEEAFVKEKEIILQYKQQGYCEANFTNGGEGSSGRIVSEETKQKMREANLGFKHSEETKRKMSEAGQGRIFTEEHRKKISESLMGHQGAFLGRQHTEETRRKMSISSIGKNKGQQHWLGKNHTEESIEKIRIAKSIISDETRKKMSASHSRIKPFICCLDNGKIYRTLKEAAIELQLNITNLNKALKYSKKYRGYNFQYVDKEIWQSH